MVTTLKSQINGLRELLDQVEENIDEENFSVYSQLREDLETAIAELEEGGDIPEPTSRIERVSLPVSEGSIPLPVQPTYDDSVDVRDPIPYPTEPRAFTESAKRIARGGGRQTSTPSGQGRSGLQNEIWTSNDFTYGAQPSPYNIGRLMRNNGYRTPQSFINTLQNNNVKYYAVLKGVEDPTDNYVPIIYCEDAEEENCHLVPLWNKYTNTGMFRSTKVARRYQVDGSLDEVKEVAGDRIGRKTGFSDDGKMFMVKGSMSAVNNVGMSRRSRNYRNNKFRQLTGINNGMFVYRSPERPPKYTCPLEYGGETDD